MSKDATQLYQAFLIRCWLIPAATAGEIPAWRFELRQVPADSQKHRFSKLEQVEEFMSAKLTTYALNSDDAGDRQGGESSQQK